MTTALLGLAFIVLIALSTVALGALTRLLAARTITPRGAGRGGAEARSAGAPGAARDLDTSPLTPLERLALGNEIIARDLQPDDVHPVARTADDGAARASGSVFVRPADGAWLFGPDPRADLGLRHPEISSHALR